MPLERCVAGIGEVLIDLFDHGEATVGGAPFNVVFHLNQLVQVLPAGETVFLSAVGRDEWGRKIRSSFANAGISLRYLAEVDQPTGTALVFEEDGGAGFEIQHDVAWDFIQLEPSALELARQCEAVVFGSLAVAGFEGKHSAFRGTGKRASPVRRELTPKHQQRLGRL
jgi:fructokinase